VTPTTLPSGVSWDSATLTLHVGRGRTNTAILLGVGILLFLGGGAMATALALESGAPAGQRVGAMIGGAIALIFLFVVLRLLWTAGWSLSPTGVIIRTGTRRSVPWAQIVALELSTGHSGTAGNDYELNIRTRSGELEVTPTRQRRGDLERILSFAIERGAVPGHVKVKM
jgi:hypothetical protein